MTQANEPDKPVLWKSPATKWLLGNTPGRFSSLRLGRDCSGHHESGASRNQHHDNWFELVWTKAVVSLDIIPELMGKLDTQETYDSHRAEMAEIVWRKAIANDSEFCRSCHAVDAMDMELQGRRPARRHSQAAEKGQTYVECHNGIVHKLPENADAISEEILGATKPE